MATSVLIKFKHFYVQVHSKLLLANRLSWVVTYNLQL
jgi:hypothetical protein